MCRVTTLKLLTFALWSLYLLHHYNELANWYLTNNRLDTSFNSMNFLKCSYPEPSAGMLSQASFLLVVLALASCTSGCRNGSKHHKLLCIWLQLCDIMLARHSTCGPCYFSLLCSTPCCCESVKYVSFGEHVYSFFLGTDTDVDSPGHCGAVWKLS